MAKETNYVTQVQILDEAVCICQNANTLGNGTVPTVPTVLPSPNYGYIGQTGPFNLGIGTSLGEGKPVALHSKIDLASHPACGRGCGLSIFQSTGYPFFSTKLNHWQIFIGDLFLNKISNSL